MKISHRYIPKFQQPAGALPSLKEKKTNILTFNPNGNNIYYTGDWENYHNWHSGQIVLPWLENFDEKEAKQIDWENYIKFGLDSWNDAGGFDWLEATPEQRQHRMNSEGTKTHQQLIINQYPGLNVEIGKHLNDYFFPSNANTGDRYDQQSGKLVGNNGMQTDTDFGIQTGNRRPSIHIKSDPLLFNKWSNYYSKLGYVGAYKYLDHWVPTTDESKADITFVKKDSPSALTSLPIPPVDKEALEHVRARTSALGESDWTKAQKYFQKLFNNPSTFGLFRLAGNLINNDRIYDEALKGIKPDLRQTYQTHRQVVGDEATKQAYYRRAAQGQTQAAKPFTSDADKQMAYQYEAKRAADELRAQGDLADNQMIQKTSDESNQHQWANTQRATEVANANIASINQANALKHNLLAQKHSAQWSSIDNYLLEQETRRKQQYAEQQSLNDNIWTLMMQNELRNDNDVKKAQAAYDKAVLEARDENGNINWESPAIKNAEDALAVAQNNLYIKFLKKKQQYLQTRNGITISKKGTKITRKKKDDLLYKTASDIAKHFREMSKMSSDSYNRKRIKIEKLTSHPKNVQKYQQGGLAPFTIYRPAPMGGESTVSTETTTSSSKSKDSGQDLLKELFKNLALEGLPSDVNSVYSSMYHLLRRKTAFGGDLSYSDVAGLYIQQMQRINNIKYQKAQFDKSQEIVNKKNANSELAIDPFGRLVLQNIETRNIEYKYLDDYKENSDKYIPLTNDQVLNLRALSNSFDTTLFQVANNSTSMEEISKFLKENLSNIGSGEQTIEGYTKQDSNLIVKGIQVLKDAPVGEYKFSEYKKNLTADQRKQVTLAMAYLQNILPTNMKVFLQANAELRGTMSYQDLIATLVNSRVDDKYEFKLTAATGKASSKSNSDQESIKSNPLMQMVMGQGGVPRTLEIVTRDSKVKMSVDGMSYSGIHKIKGDTSLDKMLSESGLSEMLDNKYGITFGDQPINPDNFKDVMYSDSGGMVVTLPCKIVNGHKEVNLGVRETYEKAVEEVKSKGLREGTEEYNKALGEKLEEEGLNSLLTSNGYPDPNKFGKFLAIEAYTTDKVKTIDTSSQYIEKVKNPSDELEQRLIKALSTDKDKSNYSLDIDYWFYGDDVYRATVFIPLTNNLNAAINAWGDQVSVENARGLEEKFQTFNKAQNSKPSNSEILYETK